jgi:hypothetical protein
MSVRRAGCAEQEDMMTKANPKRAAAATATKLKAQAETKLTRIVELLKRAQGASLAEIVAATGWQAHSVRGALSGHIRGKLKLPLLSEKTDGVRVYRLASGEDQ